MSHPFGDLLSQHLHRKHGLSQAKLAEGILQDPSIIGKMCKGKRLRGTQARERVVAIIAWLRQQTVLKTVSEANTLLAAAEMSMLSENTATEHVLLQQLHSQPFPRHSTDVSPVRKTNLPAPLTSFLGRAEEVETVAHAIASHRLVTLTGAGGVGKTRLAIEVGIHLMESENSFTFSDGIWLVELATLSRETTGMKLVIYAIGALFKLSAQSDDALLDLLQEHLTNKHLLLIFDNCEHLVEICAEVAQQLLEHCWHLHILATSREELRIPGETIHPVLPLRLPNLTDHTAERVMVSTAAQLFVERMGMTSSNLKASEGEVAAIAHICRQLDGIPLALELAAPLIRSMTLDEIASQLDNQMALLTNGYRTVIPRHQTMHSALIWSYRLLSPKEQCLLARVSVFAGGWTVAAAQAVYSDDPGVSLASSIQQLVAKSFVLIEKHNGEHRYRLLEPVRQFAYTQLIADGEQEAIRTRHAYLFLDLAKKMDQARDTLQEREWLQRLEIERDNVRSVNQWAIEHNEAEFAQCFNGFLCAFWIYCSSRSEANYWLTEVLALAGTVGEAERTTSAQMAEASALNAAGHAATLIDDFARAKTLFERELKLRTKLDDHRGIANALRGIGYALMLNNNLIQAQPYVDQALLICRSSQDRWGVAWSLFDLGYLAMVRADPTAEHTLLEEALPLLQEQGITFGVFRTFIALGQLMRTTGNNKKASLFYTNALRLQQQMHYIPYIADGLEGFAAIAAATNDPQRAGRLFGAAHTNRQSVAMLRLYHQEASYEHAVALTRQQLDPATWNSAWLAGCAMSLEQAVEYALTT